MCFLVWLKILKTIICVLCKLRTVEVFVLTNTSTVRNLHNTQIIVLRIFNQTKKHTSVILVYVISSVLYQRMC
jgi:hypothetical protein